MSELKIEQAILYKYTDSRTAQCVEIPHNFPILNVQLPSTMMNQTKPLEGSLVLVASPDNFKHYIIAVLREPSPVFNQNADQTLSSDAQFRESLQPGEVFLQATGTSSQGTGNDAYLYIGNNGSIELVSSSGQEQIIVGGETSDDQDHEDVIRAPNVTIESTLTEAVGVQSTFNFDDNNNLQIANTTVTVSTSISVPISELTMDALGNTVLRNTTAGVDKSFLKLNTTGDVQLGNTLSKLELDPAGNATLNATTINLNNGTQGAARLGDSTFSSVIQDPAFWQFIENLFIVFNSHAHESASPGNPTSPPITPLFTFPTQMSGVISSGSGTVRIGD